MAWYDGIEDFFSNIGSSIESGAGSLMHGVENLFTPSSTPTVDPTMGGLTEADFGGTAGTQTSGGGFNLGGGISTPSAADMGLTGTSMTPSTQTTKPGFVDSAMNAITKNPVMSIMLALTAANAMRGPQTSTAEKTLTAQQKIPNAVANQQMQQFQSGQLTLSDQQALEQWKQQQKVTIDDYYAKAGLSDSEAHVDALNSLQQQAIAKADELRQKYLANALSASQAGGNIASALAQVQQSGDTAASNALMQMLMAAGYSGKMSS